MKGIITLPIGKFLDLILFEEDGLGLSGKRYYEVCLEYDNRKNDLKHEAEQIEIFYTNFFETPGVAILKLAKVFNLVLEIVNEEDSTIVLEKIQSYKDEGALQRD